MPKLVFPGIFESAAASGRVNRPIAWRVLAAGRNRLDAKRLGADYVLRATGFTGSSVSRCRLLNTGGRYDGVCLLLWSGLHRETEEPFD